MDLKLIKTPTLEDIAYYQSKLEACQRQEKEEDPPLFSFEEDEDESERERERERQRQGIPSPIALGAAPPALIPYSKSSQNVLAYEIPDHSLPPQYLTHLTQPKLQATKSSPQPFLNRPTKNRNSFVNNHPFSLDTYGQNATRPSTTFRPKSSEGEEEGEEEWDSENERR